MSTSTWSRTPKFFTFLRFQKKGRIQCHQKKILVINRAMLLTSALLITSKKRSSKKKLGPSDFLGAHVCTWPTASNPWENKIPTVECHTHSGESPWPWGIAFVSYQQAFLFGSRTWVNESAVIGWKNNCKLLWRRMLPCYNQWFAALTKWQITRAMAR